MSTEQCFPRGGYSTNNKTQNSNSKEHVSQHTESEKLFGEFAKKLKKQRKSQPKNPSMDLEPFSMSDTIVPDQVDALTYQKIQEGMLLFGCVKYVTSLNGVQVQLPGRCYGHISIHDISYEYTKSLIDALDSGDDGNPLSTHKQFQSGDFLPVKVLAKISEENGFRVPLSTKPEDVNCYIKFNQISIGILLWASVIERSDHCFNLNVGIPNCRVVMPIPKAKFEYLNGENTWCIVQNVNIHDNASILTVSTLQEDIQKVSLKKNTSLDILTPGMTVPFKVQKILKDGLRGTICQNSTAFIQTINLSKLKDNPQNYRVGQMLNATLLYIQPTSKFSYLTLQNTSCTPAPCLSIGAKLEGKVLATKDKGLYISLKSEERGFVPYNRLQILKNPKNKSDSANKSANRVIAENYPKNTSFTVRIMDYNYMERTYICTNESVILNEKYFTISDLKIGDIVEGKIKDINAKGAVFLVGRIQGFIPNMHLCDVKFTETIKSKLSMNKKMTAKVLNVKPNTVYFTLKRSLIKNDLNLSSADQIDTANNYPGVVVTLSRSNNIVQFYGDFTGQLDTSVFKDQPYVTDMFYRGQVILTRIARIEDDIPVLTISSNGNSSEGMEIVNNDKNLKKKKKRALSESSVIIENVKKTKVQSDFNDNDDINKTIEVKLQPILQSITESNGKVDKDMEFMNNDKKKKKKRLLSESSAAIENVKKSKVESDICDSSDINDTDESDKNIPEKLQPILKSKPERNGNVKRKENGNEYINSQNGSTEESVSKKRKSITFNDKPFIKVIQKSVRPDICATKCGKPLAIRGVSDFFSTTTLRLDSDTESEEDELIVEPKQKTKKKPSKQTAADRRENQLKEEERLRAIEIKLADNSSTPQSAEQFDRLLLGQPNSSKLWAQYIAFHMQSIEIEKARSVARRALQTINQMESQERLNIWTVFLNLEHEYGTMDSYDEIFKEAVSCNNSLPIYLLSIENHVVKGDFAEAGVKWRKLKREHKNNLQMWVKVGKIYYENKKFDEARKLKDDGLKTITDKTMQIDLIVQFAIFEFNYGDSSQGETLFETIVQSDPKRVNIWSIYVDQLVKKNDIELARRVLDRAVGNKIPFKKMRTLFKKYYQFEKQHGDAEKLSYVEKLAKQYAFSVSAL